MRARPSRILQVAMLSLLAAQPFSCAQSVSPTASVSSTEPQPLISPATAEAAARRYIETYATLDDRYQVEVVLIGENFNVVFSRPHVWGGMEEVWIDGHTAKVLKAYRHQ